VEWARLAPLIPPALPGGRPRTDVRAAMNAILYLLRTRLPLALPAARQLFAALDRLQYLSQVPARSSLGGDLGRAAYGIPRAKDFENLTETLATFVTLAAIQLALMQLARA
jgi:hypothetical protein